MKYPCDGCVLSNHCRGNCEDLNKWIRVAKDAIEKQNKYRWHDLRKNPDDLPEKYTNIVYIFKCDGITHYNTDNYSCGLFESWKDGYGREYEYIAWRDIEPFEEG